MYIMYRLNIYSDKILRYMVVFIYLYKRKYKPHKFTPKCKKTNKNPTNRNIKVTKMLLTEARISEVIKNRLNQR